MATDNKYDRQLRLWGHHGQRALSEARVLLLGAGATGTETLKNLVLPGVGHVEIVDDRKVTEDDCADQFFVTHEQIGQDLAKVTQEWLVEMNPDVSGAFHIASPTTFVSDPSLLAGFSLVVATQMTSSQVVELERHCIAAKVPLIVARTYGLVGLVRVCAGEHLVVESKPDSAKPDWRLAAPFSELQAYCDAFDVSDMSSELHSHVPFPVLLVQLMKKYTSLGNTVPSTFREGKAFKKFIVQETPTDYLNYAEALEFAHFAYTKPQVPGEVAKVLEMAKNRKLTPQSERFWFAARAVADFVDNEGGGLLPQCAVLPDLTATAEWYIQLQRVYKAKADADCAVVVKRCNELVQSVSKESEADDAVSVPTEFVESFCRNAQFVRVYSYRTVAEEIDPATAHKADIAEEMWSLGDMQPLKWYLALRACDRFHAKTGAFPGIVAEAEDADVGTLFKEAEAVCGELELAAGTLTSDHAKEMVRYGACEPHNIAAVIGGIASQEAVKLITKQYQPLNNTYVFNGIACIGAQIEL